MKILEFIKGSDGKYSSKRLMSFCAVLGVMTDSSSVVIIGKYQYDNKKQNEKFGVNLDEPLKISKIYTNMKKYNL